MKTFIVLIECDCNNNYNDANDGESCNQRRLVPYFNGETSLQQNVTYTFQILVAYILVLQNASVRGASISKMDDTTKNF
jgi:hypothetical protein